MIVSFVRIQGVLLLTKWINQSLIKKIFPKLDRIEGDFDKGDGNNACDLKLKLSKDLLTYEKVSPELLTSAKEFQLKFGNRSLLIHFGKDK